MLPPFDLSVPSDDRYRSLSSEAAVKYAELAGRSSGEAQALGAEVDAATARLGKADQNIDVKLSSSDTAVVVALECAGQSATLKTR